VPAYDSETSDDHSHSAQPSPRHRVSRKNDNLIDYNDASDDGAAPAKRKKIGVRVDVEQMPEEEEEVLETITTEMKKMAR
jgi:hypothetical protein